MIWQRFAKAVIVLEEYNYQQPLPNPLYHPDARLPNIEPEGLSPQLKEVQDAFLRALVYDLPNPGHVVSLLLDATKVIPAPQQFIHLRDSYISYRVGDAMYEYMRYAGIDITKDSP